MSSTKPLKTSLKIIFPLLLINIALILIFPAKPLKIKEISLPKSAIDPQIKISFSEPIDKNSLSSGGFILTPDIPGNISWSGNTFVFTPEENLEFDTEYRLQLNTTILSKRNTTLANNLTETFKTPSLKLLYLNNKNGNSSQIFHYDLTTTLSKPLTDENHNVVWFDYDPSTQQIIALITEKDSASDIVTPYLLDLNNPTLHKLTKITTPDRQIHYAKWIPYENSLLISRSKIQYLNEDQSIASLTGNPEDTELLVYNLNTGKSQQLLTGNTLFYEFFPTPDGRGFSFINSNGALVAYDFEKKSQEMISAEFVNYFGFSHYGKYVLYADKIEDTNFLNEEDIAILQSSSGEKESIRLEGVNPIVIDSLTTSPSDEVLAAGYTSYPANFLITLVDITTGNQSIINEGEGRANFLTFSPDNDYLAYIEEIAGNPQIFIYSMTKKENIVENLSGSMIHWFY